MEGVAVYRNFFDEPTLIMYKEYSNNNVFFAIYCNKKLQYQFISTKFLTEIIPKECIHILTSLPFNRDINIMLNIWFLLIKNRLIFLMENI
uniref:Uncharacterized protein n=1 Tax=viral metagenome TaxID=1070528 RepID=A0A6C0AX03_9ZZZZ|tara:strand:+ start:277 stop:549 length:273 start_codon:yes stop_codon:yes gene_type:complete